MCISPNWVLWHSSIIKITFSSLYISIAILYFSLFNAFDIFWIVVTINLLLLSFICFTNFLVVSVESTEPASNLLNSAVVWESKSLLSTKKNTFFILVLDFSMFDAKKLVNVWPAPVVWKINPLLAVSNACLIKASIANTW